MLDAAQTIANSDPELWRAIGGDLRRQKEHLEWIASENYVSRAVMQAQGPLLANKYAEGYPQNDIAVAASSSMLSSGLLSSVETHSSALTAPTSWRIRAPRQMQRCTWRSSTLAIPFSTCRLPMANT